MYADLTPILGGKQRLFLIDSQLKEKHSKQVEKRNDEVVKPCQNTTESMKKQFEKRVANWRLGV